MPAHAALFSSGPVSYTHLDVYKRQVLYLRKAVLQAGNWDPAVSRLEEIDLYSRIRSLGFHIRALDLPMADHFTDHLPLGSKLGAVLWPWRERCSYLGANQLISSRLRQKDVYKRQSGS